MRTDVWTRRGLLAVILLAPLAAAGDEPAGQAPAADTPPPEQTAAPAPAPESAPTERRISIEPFIPSEKVSADTAVAFPVDI